MTSARIALLVTFAFTITGCAATASAAQGNRLNLLIITADDMNADTPGWTGDKLKVTPNLDAFAATAHRFVNAHVTVPICMPGRSAFMTGLVPHRNGALGFNPVKPGTPTMVTTLQDAGYYTAVIDKHVHMKGDKEFPWDVRHNGGGKNPAMMRQHLLASIKAAAAVNKPLFLNANITDPHRPFPGAGPKAIAGKPRQAKKASGNAAEKPATEKPATDKPVEEKSSAEKPVSGDDNKNSDTQPAAVSSANSPPSHVYTAEQMTIPSFLEDLPALRKELAQYYTGVGRLDETFKQIMDVLHETGHDDDTIVVFMSDHGISMPFAKATVYRNGTSSPIVLRWPGMGESQTRKEFVSSVDLMPTLLELLEIKAPKAQDGRSLLPLLRGQSQEGRDHVVTHVNTVSSGNSFPQRCVRTADVSLMFMSWPDGTEKFKVEAMNGEAFRSMLDGARDNQKVAARVRQLVVGQKLAFYDLRADPDERHNLIDDPAKKSEVDRLSVLLLDHMKRTDDPQAEAFQTEWDRYVKNR